MDDKEKMPEDKEETQAIAGQPQEEFITPESVPSHSETPAPRPGEKKSGEPPTP